MADEPVPIRMVKKRGYMVRINIPSETLKSAGYDPEKKILELEFPSGIIQYFKVPEKVYAGLLNAESYGLYFINKIKYIYPYKQLEA
jgi:hypothetical protein